MSPILIDFILIAVIVLLCFMGYKRGLMLSLVNVGSSIISMILSFILYPVISKILKATPLFAAIRQKAYEYIEIVTAHLANSATKPTAGEVVNTVSIPDVMKDNILAQITGSDRVVNDFQSLKASLADIITGLILDIIAIVVLFIVVKIVIMMLKNVIKAVASIPVIKQVDNIGGLVFGLVEGIILITVVAAIFSFFSSNIGSQSFIESINKSIIANYFYNHNFILNIISGKPVYIPDI